MMNCKIYVQKTSQRRRISKGTQFLTKEGIALQPQNSNTPKSWNSPLCTAVSLFFYEKKPIHLNVASIVQNSISTIWCVYFFFIWRLHFEQCKMFLNQFYNRVYISRFLSKLTYQIKIGLETVLSTGQYTLKKQKWNCSNRNRESKRQEEKLPIYKFWHVSQLH